MRCSPLMLLLLAAVAAPLVAQVDPLDRERGRIVQQRQDLREQIRFAFFNRQFDRVLELCDEMETIDPQGGFSQQYRMMALEEMRREAASPRAASTEAGPLSSAPRPPLQVRPGPASPGLAVTAPPSPALGQVQPLASGSALPREDTRPAFARDLEEGPPPRRPRGTVTIPLLGEVNQIAAGFALGVVIMILLSVTLLLRMRRRVSRVSGLLTQEAEGAEPEVSWEPAPEESSTPTGGSAPSSALDEAFAGAATATPAASGGKLGLAGRGRARPSAAPAPATVATLAAPWSSLDEAVEAIRGELRRPRVMPPPPPKEEEVQPVSLEDVGLPQWDPRLPRGAAPAKPSEVGAPSAKSGGEESLQMVDADDMLFLGVGESEKPSSAPPPPPASPPAAPKPSAPGLDLGLDLDSEPSAAASPAPEEPAPPMTPHDVLEVPRAPLIHEPPREERTGPPLNLDDLLGPMESAPLKPAGVVEGGISGPAPAPEKPEPPSGEPSPPPPRKPAAPFDPAELEETVTLTTTPRLPKLPDTDKTLDLEPDEIDEVLREVAPPTETMAASSARTQEPSADRGTNDALFMDYYRQGLEAANDQDWAQAIHFFDLALSIRPDSPEILRHLRAAQIAQRSGSAGANADFTPGL
jgi:hypothetical protein